MLPLESIDANAKLPPARLIRSARVSSWIGSVSVGCLKEDVATDDITMPERLAFHVCKAADG